MQNSALDIHIEDETKLTAKTKAPTSKMMGKATAVYHTILNKDLAHLSVRNTDMSTKTSTNNIKSTLKKNSKVIGKQNNLAASSKFTQRL